MSRHGMYLLLGPDRPSKFQRIQRLEQTLGVQPLDRHQLDATTITAPALIALCRQQPATSPVRLIVVDQAHRLDRACVDALLHHAKVMAQSACLVLFVETELNVRHPLLTVGDAMTIERFPGRDTPSAKPFALTDTLGMRDVAGALGATQDQLLAGKEPLELLGLVAWQLQRWVTVKRLQQAGYSVEGIASATSVRPWQIQRLQSEVAARSLASLQGLLERCWQLDVDAKRGRHIPGLAIEQLVLDVCLTDAAEPSLVSRT